MVSASLSRYPNLDTEWEEAMTTRTQAQVVADDRRMSGTIAWLSVVAAVLLFTLAARDASSLGTQSAALIKIDMTEVVSDEVVIIPPVARASAPAPARTAERPIASGSGLLGLDASALRSILGAPDFVRRDGNTQMWRYGRGACTLTLFLHGEDERMAVEHVEGRGLRSPIDPSADCAERLVGEGRRADLPG
jgi:hypothetical protein